MSRFLSAWVGRPIGDAKPTIYCEPTIDSHEVLKTLFKVKAEERGTVINAARVEFTPSVGPDDVPDYLAFDKYELRVDENETPGWFDEDVKSFVVKALTKILKAMLIDDDSRPILYGGAWILGPNAKVEYADSCRVVALCGGTLTAMCGGTLTTMWGDYDPKVIWKYDADVPKGWKKDKSGLLVPANKKVKK